jgi:hypothetical protein
MHIYLYFSCAAQVVEKAVDNVEKCGQQTDIFLGFPIKRVNPAVYNRVHNVLPRAVFFKLCCHCFPAFLQQKIGKKLALSPNDALWTPAQTGLDRNFLLKLHIFRNSMIFLPKEILKAQNITGGTQCREK